MSRILKSSIILLAIAGGLHGAERAKPAGPNATSVVSAAARAQAIQAAGDLLAPRSTTWRTITADMPDPFFRSNFVRTTVAQQGPVEPPKVEGVAAGIEQVADMIKPTGTILIGNEPYLLINGRRYKVGDQITITLEGLVYQVAISSIERNQYTLRLNDQELRREFK